MLYFKIRSSDISPNNVLRALRVLSIKSSNEDPFPNMGTTLFCFSFFIQYFSLIDAFKCDFYHLVIPKHSFSFCCCLQGEEK